MAAWLAGACAGVLLAAGVASAQTATFEARVIASLDDVEQNADLSMYVNSSDLELIHDTSDQIVGIRWTGLSIPKGATITTAWIQFSAKEAQSEVTSLNFYGQAADAAPQFTANTNDVGARPRTTAFVNWQPGAWSAGQVTTSQRTPELKAVVQEIVNRSGWASGNPLAIIINGTGHRTAWAWDGSAAQAALLHIEYSTAGQTDQPPVANLAVSQVATPALTVSASAAGSTDTDSTPIAKYSFNWGDGTAATVVNAPTQTATHTYAAAGTYTVTLVATDTGNLASAPVTKSITVTFDAPPVPNLTVTQASSPPLTVTASGAGSTDTDGTPIAKYSFNFGDGTSAVVVNAPAQTATHTYGAAGSYTVTLIVTDTGANASTPKSVGITVNPPSNATTIDQRIAASSDDAEEASTSNNNNRVTLTSPDLQLIHDASDQTVGMRWPGLTIPKGATIKAAWIQFASTILANGATNLTLRAQAADNAGMFTTGRNNVSSRALTSASTAWTPVAWNAGEVGVNERTPDLSAVVQEVVNRSGWASGSALAIIVSGTGSRTARAYDGNAAQAPLLHIEYSTTSGPPAQDQPPVAKLAVTQASSPPLTVNASAAGSSDTDNTPIAKYSFNWGDGSANTVVNAPAQTASHTYAASGTYTVTLIVTDTAQLSSPPATASVTVNPAPVGNVAVYVGYYDTHHPDHLRTKPSPWLGGSGVVFVGKDDDGKGNWDSSTLRVDNNTGSSVSVVVTCDIGSNHYALWGTRTIPAGGMLILAQTAFQNFDGSDTSPAGCYGCDPSLCLTKVVNTVPVIHVTIGGVTTNYSDTKQILNTKGADGAGCPDTGGTRNDESTPWTQIFQSASIVAFGVSDDRIGLPVDMPRVGLAPIAPNPVRDDLLLRFTVPTTSRVTIGLYDVAGRLVRTWLDREMGDGIYQQLVSANGVNAGVYYCLVTTSSGSAHRSIVVSR